MAKHRPQLIAAGLLLTALAGCGFQLRGDYSLPASINPVYVEAARADIKADLGRLLQSSEVQVTTDRKRASGILRLRSHRADRRVLALDSNGKVAEYGLIEELRFDMIDAQGKILVPEQKIRAMQSYINSGEQVLGKQQEEGSLRRDIRRDLAAQMMRRLQTQLK